SDLEQGDILLGDALYGSYYVLAECLERGIDVVFQQNGGRKRTTDFRRGKHLGSKDHLIRIKKPVQRPGWMSAEHFRNLPAEIVIREVALESKVLITTLNDATQVPREALKALYRSRWHVELDIRNIKTTLGMETLTCKTPEMAEKEMWVYLLAYNLIRILMAQSAALSDVLPR
ncbi:transposase, partial [Alcanivorax sp. HI0083]